MSKCITCDYALYDGMCLAQGKFTLLDADSCELYKPTQDSEVARLKMENAELRELCRDLFDRLMDKDEHCGECRSSCEYDAWNFGDPKCVYAKRMRELGVVE